MASAIEPSLQENDFIFPLHNVSGTGATPADYRPTSRKQFSPAFNCLLSTLALRPAESTTFTPPSSRCVQHGRTPIRIKRLFKINCFPGKQISATVQLLATDRHYEPAANQPDCISPKRTISISRVDFPCFRSRWRSLMNGHRVSYLGNYGDGISCPTTESRTAITSPCLFGRWSSVNRTRWLRYDQFYCWAGIVRAGWLLGTLITITWLAGRMFFLVCVGCSAALNERGKKIKATRSHTGAPGRNLILFPVVVAVDEVLQMKS